MGWSMRIARIKGIDIRIHITFPFIFLLFAVQFWAQLRGWRGALFGVVAAALLFVCVVLHELGHSLVAQRFGTSVRDITLWPIGGVARMEEMPRQPWQELLMSIAGPSVNFVIAAALGMLAVSTFDAGAIGGMARVIRLIRQPEPTWQALLSYLLSINLSLGMFNLIPAFPMDGGRVLRSLLALTMDYVQATRIAVAIGQGIALLFGLAGLLIPGQFMLMLIAIFIFLGAGQEGQVVAARQLLEGLQVHQAASRETHVVSPSDPLSHVVDLTLSTHQADFMVIEGGRLVGVLSRDAVLEGLRRYGAEVPVGRVMCAEYPTVELHDTLLLAQRKMAAARCQALPVLEGGQPVGLLTLEDINEIYALMTASPQILRQARR